MTAPKPEESNTAVDSSKYTRATTTNTATATAARGSMAGSGTATTTTTQQPAPTATVNLSPAVSAFQFRPHNNITNNNNNNSNHHLSPHHHHHRPLDRSLSSEGVSLSTNISGSYHYNSSNNSKSRLSTSPSSSLDLKRSHSNHTTTPTSITRSPSPVSPRAQKTVIKDGYVYKDEVVILDKEQKEELLKVGEIGLQSEWTFWYDRYVPNLPPTEYEANLQVISTVGTVQKFWSIYNNIDGPDQLGFRSNLHFMRKGIKPIWEDPQNEHGGSYNFKIPKAHSPLAWRDLLVLLIGEKIEGSLGDTVCGVSVSSRQQCDNYQVWTAHTHHSDNVADGKVRSILTELLRPAEIQSFYYKVHKNHAAFQKTPQPHQQYHNNYQHHHHQQQQQHHHHHHQHPQQQQQHQQQLSKWPDDPSSLLKTPLEMRQRITEESIEKVVADIERLSMKHKERTRSQHQHQQQNN